MKPARVRAGNPAITRAVLDRHFSAFNDYGERDLKRAREAAINFCLAMASENEPGRWLTFLGTSGGGKSMLTKLITKIFGRLDHLVDETKGRGGDRFLRSGGFKPWCDVIGEMRTGDFSGVRQLKEDWYVAADDIGAEQQTPLSIGKLYEIMTAREGKFTVFNANLTLEALAAIDVRLASRVKRDGNILVEIETEDHSLRN